MDSRNVDFIGEENMSNIMDYIKSGKGLPPLEDNISPMPEVKPPKREKHFDKYYELKECDVKDILAEYFNVKIDNVSIEIVPVCTGYGTMEHDEYHMKVTVKV